MKRIVRAKGRAWFDDEKRAYCFNGTLQDITEQEGAHLRLQDEVALRTVELRRSNEDLLQFAHVISHDLKEPVRKTTIFSHRVVDEFADALPDKALKYLKKVLQASDRMHSMIESVLNYSAASSIAGDLGPVDISDVFRHVCNDLELVIEQKGAQVRASGLPVVTGVQVLIYQLFYNVINNALKFTRPDASPVIEVRAEVATDVAGFVQVLVSDNGIGFRADQSESIFNSFTRLHSKDKFEGTGLGLALAKRIVERHGGTIYATGEPGKGANIVFTLPIAMDQA